MMRRLLLSILSIALLISFTACDSYHRNPQENQIKIYFINEAEDAVYGIQVEYLVDRVRTGGMVVSNDQDMTVPFEKDERIYCGIPEKMVLEGADEIHFGMLVYVGVEDQRAVPVKFMWEWTAAYNTEYVFTLSGSEDERYTIVKNSGTFDCAVTPYDELPKDILE